MFERHSDPDVGDSGEDGGSRQQKKAKRPEYQIEGPGRRVRFDSEELDNLAKGVEKFGCGELDLKAKLLSSLSSQCPHLSLRSAPSRSVVHFCIQSFAPVNIVDH
mmetsp:Transcript_878/g.2116  ORF Transcript_878/g.2116 Transcript_878/m.2116 type:complete len:105 (+) Transcript_878:812-1126(+)